MCYGTEYEKYGRIDFSEVKTVLRAMLYRYRNKILRYILYKPL